MKFMPSDSDECVKVTLHLAKVGQRLTPEQRPELARTMADALFDEAISESDGRT